MQTTDSIRSGASAARHCPARSRCPLGGVCGEDGLGGSTALLPYFTDAEPGELLFSDLRFEQRVHVVRTGVFTTAGAVENERNAAFALYGSGHGIGMSELYIPRKTTETYLVRALTAGTLCSFPTNALRRKFEALDPLLAMRILSCAFTNIANQAFAQSVVVTRPRVYDRLVALLLFMRELMEHEGRELDEVRLSHEIVAVLVASDRLTTMRALHKLEQDGLVELGYRSIKLLPALLQMSAPDGARLVFYRPE